MTREKALELWQSGDGAAIAAAVGITRQAVHVWRYGGGSKHEAAILEACSKRFAGRRRVPGFVVVDAGHI